MRRLADRDPDRLEVRIPKGQRHYPWGGLCRTHVFYNLTCDDFDDLWRHSDGLCCICRVDGPSTPHGMLHIDHGRGRRDDVRGLLCSRCNTQIGRPVRMFPSDEQVSRYLANAWYLSRRAVARRDEQLAHQGRDTLCVAQQLRAATQIHKQRQARADRTREELYAAIRSAAAAGVKQVELVRRTGYTREHIRRICDPEWNRKP